MASDGRWYPPDIHSPAARAALPGPPFPGGEPVGRPRPVPGYRWLIVALTVVALALGAVIVVQVTGSAGTPMSKLHVVAGPVAAGNRALVVARSASGALALAAVDPASRTVSWQLPYAASDITAGVELTPAVIDGMTVDLAPGNKRGSVITEGVSISSGTVAWRRAAGTITSPPSACAGHRYFCVIGQSRLQLLAPMTGAVVRTVPGVERTLATDLFELTATPETWSQVGSSGSVAWTRPLSSIFGPGYSSNYGWAIFSADGIDYGSVSAVPQGSSNNLGRSKTVGFSSATGQVIWSLPGEFECGGELLSMSTAPVVCRFSGTIHQPSPGTLPSLAGVTLDMEGIDPTTGKITWTRLIHEVKQVTFATGTPFAAGTRIVMATPGGPAVTLDLRTGAETPVHAGTVFWCAHTVTSYPTRTAQGGRRSGAPDYRGCTESGAPIPTRPSAFPRTVGVTVGQDVIWLSPTGLQTAPAGS